MSSSEAIDRITQTSEFSGLTNTTHKKDENKNECMWYIGGSICGLGLLAAVVCYFVYGIIFLVNDYNTWHECENDSDLWPYVLVGIILSWNKMNAKQLNNDDSSACEIITMIMCSLFIELGLAIWGAIDLYDLSQKTCCPNTLTNSTNTCDELYNTNLWTFAAVTNSFSWLFIGIVIIFIIVCCCLDRKKNNVEISEA